MKFNIRRLPISKNIRYPGLARHGGEETLFQKEVGPDFQNWETYYGKRQSAILEGTPGLFHAKSRREEFDQVVSLLSISTDSRVLDYGCATISFGEHLIRFLDPQCYVGMDVSKQAVDLARSRIRGSDLYLKGPIVLHLEGELFPSETLLPFDYVIALSVFTHCPPKTVLNIMKFVKTLLKSGGKFMIDICLVDKDIIFQGFHNFYYPREFFEYACERFGLQYEIAPHQLIGKKDPRALGDYYRLIVTA